MSHSTESVCWAIAEECIPFYSNGLQPNSSSYETIPIIDPGNSDAHVEITIYYSDKEPVGPYRLNVSTRRHKSVIFNNLTEGESIPQHTYFTKMIASDVPSLTRDIALNL
jgi:hypothetical protein